MAASHSNGNGFKVLVPAVAYYRMSGERQETSIPDQKLAVERFANTIGYRILHEYFEPAISGDATEKRVQFQQMIADAESGEFKAILCWDQDRFGRFDSIEAGRWIHPLRQAGVHLATVGQGVIDWTDFASRMIFGITAEAKHQFLRDLARNSQRGKLEAAKRGDMLINKATGYAIENGKLVLGDPAEVELVRGIFRGYLDGKSLRMLAGELNAAGIPSPRGKKWSSNAIRGMLKNVTYIGTYKYNNRRSGKYTSIANGDVQSSPKPGFTDESDQFIILDHHPALIDRKTFDAVQRRLSERKNKTTPRQSGGPFVFTGLLRCGECDAAMRGRTCHANIYFTCGSNATHGYCNRNSVKQSELLEHVAKAIRERFGSSELRQRLIEALQRRAKKDTSKANVGQLVKQLATVNGKLDKAKKRLVEVDADMLPVVQEHIRELRGQHDKLIASLEAARTPQKRLAANIEDTVNERWKRSQGYQSGYRGSIPCYSVRSYNA